MRLLSLLALLVSLVPTESARTSAIGVTSPIAASSFASVSLDGLGVARANPCSDDLRSGTLTGLANATSAALGLHDDSVLGRERVARVAVSLAGVHGGWRITAKGIHARSHRLQMSRIHAGPVATEMIELEAVRHRTDHDRVRGNMSCPDPRTALVQIRADFAVAVDTNAGPLPAHIRTAALGDFSESLSKVHSLHVTNIAVPRRTEGRLV